MKSKQQILMNLLIFSVFFSMVSASTTICNPYFSIKEPLNDNECWEQYQIPISSCLTSSCTTNDQPGEISISGGYAYISSGDNGYCGEAGIKQTISLPSNAGHLFVFVEAYEKSYGGYTGIKINDDWLLKFHTPGFKGHHKKGIYFLDISKYAGKTVDLKILIKDTSRYCNNEDHRVWIKVHSLAIFLKRKPPCGKYGDVNKDGYVDKKDYDLVFKMLRTKTYKQNADVNKNKRVDNSDLKYIINYIIGRIDTFPVCKNKPDLPDLTISGINIIPSKPSAGSTVKAEITVKNNGKTIGRNTYVFVKARVAGRTLRSEFIKLSPIFIRNSKKTVYLTNIRIPSDARKLCIYALADAYRRVSESNEKNNAKEVCFDVVPTGEKIKVLWKQGTSFYGNICLAQLSCPRGYYAIGVGFDTIYPNAATILECGYPIECYVLSNLRGVACYFKKTNQRCSCNDFRVEGVCIKG